MIENNRETKYLNKINSPEDFKAIPNEEMPAVAQEIRSELVEIVSQNGGHLSSNLGVVELTMAIHKVFDSPRDHIIFDVGHQSYVHKLLTGRYQEVSVDLPTGPRVSTTVLARDIALPHYPRHWDLPFQIS